jgi:branched-chain amino acid transport system substrate-binding protein
MKRHMLALISAVALATGGAQAEDLRIGMITTLSGPGSGLGIDIRDGFMLAVNQLDGQLGDVPTEVIEADDQRKPDVAVQLADRMVERDEVQIVTGIVWSNLALAIMPTLARGEVFFISPNAGPSALAGAQCNDYFFNVAWQNDNNHEAMGQFVQNEGYRATPSSWRRTIPRARMRWPGSSGSLTGEIVGEVYTQLGQLDYAAELAQIRAADPDAVFFFLPGGMGINFIKQYEQAGLKDEIPLFGPAFSFSQDILAPSARPLSASTIRRSGARTWKIRSISSSSPLFRRLTAGSRRFTPARAMTRRC